MSLGCLRGNYRTARTSLCFCYFERFQMRFQRGGAVLEIGIVPDAGSLLDGGARFGQLGKAKCSPATFHPVSIHARKTIIEPLNRILQRLQTLAAIVEVRRDHLVREAVRRMYQDSSLTIGGELLLKH